MAMVCSGCGGYVKPTVQEDRRSVRCPECGCVEPMQLLPLFIVTGTSGAGKSTLVPELRRLLPTFEVFDMDLMIDENWKRVRGNWLRIAHAIAQSGRGTVICGTIVPEHLADLAYRPYFSQILYINLHCDDETRAARLRARPAYRNTTDALIEEHVNFSRWLLANAETAFDPPMPTVDTTNRSPAESAASVADWVLTHWS